MYACVSMNHFKIKTKNQNQKKKAYKIVEKKSVFVYFKQLKMYQKMFLYFEYFSLFFSKKKKKCLLNIVLLSVLFCQNCGIDLLYLMHKMDNWKMKYSERWNIHTLLKNNIYKTSNKQVNELILNKYSIFIIFHWNKSKPKNQSRYGFWKFR